MRERMCRHKTWRTHDDGYVRYLSQGRQRREEVSDGQMVMRCRAGKDGTTELAARVPVAPLNGVRSANPIVAAEAEAEGGVYLLRDAETQQVMRTGRTNDLLRREAEHALDPLLKDYKFETVYRTDVYAEQRGLEQELDWIHNPPLNYKNPIGPTNPNLHTYLDAAWNYLNKIQGTP